MGIDDVRACVYVCVYHALLAGFLLLRELWRFGEINLQLAPYLARDQPPLTLLNTQTTWSGNKGVGHTDTFLTHYRCSASLNI